jgi:hypothetical protein
MPLSLAANLYPSQTSCFKEEFRTAEARFSYGLFTA